MHDEPIIICPNCGREYRTREGLRAVLKNGGYCITPGCGWNLREDDDEEVWMDWFSDGKIDGDFW